MNSTVARRGRAFALALACGAVTALASTGAQAVNLIKNGSFETPVVPVGGFTRFFNDQTLGAWTVVGVPGDVAIVSTTFVQNGIAFKAKAGQQWLDLTGFESDRATGLAQTVKTVPGQTYVLKFWVGNVVDGSGVFGTTSSVDVLVDGVTAIQANHGGGNATALNWKAYSHSFVAATKRTTISFINNDPLNDNSNGLDAVSLTPAAAE